MPDIIMPDTKSGGDPYHLVTSRAVDGPRGIGGMKIQRFTWIYVKAPSVASLEAELNGLADFAALPRPRKVAARLDLLASHEAPANYLTMEADMFEVLVDEPRTSNGEVAADGCGFIPRRMLQQILSSVKAEKSVVEQPLAIQVRVFAPRLGIFKGVLVAKRKIKRVQLAPSMRKVLPSTVGSGNPVDRDKVILLVKQVRLASRFLPCLMPQHSHRPGLHVSHSRTSLALPPPVVTQPPCTALAACAACRPISGNNVESTQGNLCAHLSMTVNIAPARARSSKSLSSGWGG